jgi:putative ABC transport system substrate-binding protein
MRLTITMVAALLLVGMLAGEARPADRVYRIGVLSPGGGRTPSVDMLEKRLGDLGWMKGRNVDFSYRYSRVNDALPALARELVQEGVDIIVSSGTPASLAAKQATTSIPVVFYSVGDPVGVGLVSSLGRPGGNVTGISGITYQLGAKRLEFLSQVLPDARLVGVLLNRTDPTASQVLGALKAGLGSVNVTVEPFYAGRLEEIEAAFEAMKRHGVNGAMVQPDGMFLAQRASIVKLAADLRLPTIYAFMEDVEAGGLMSYGASFLDMQAQAVAYIDKILRGAVPSGLPVQEPTKLELAINVKTAKALRLTVPSSLMFRADRVIE